MLAKKMFPVCLWYAKDRAEAEDIMQEGFLKVFKHLHQYNSTGSFEGWVRKIIIRTAIDKVKSNRPIYAVINIDDAAAFAEDSYAAAEILEKINIKTLIEMIQSLPPMYRLVFNLYAFENLKHREIAEQLGITEGTSKSNLHEARKILQKKINSSLNNEIKQRI